MIWWFDRYLVFKVLSNVHSIVTAGVLSLVVILGTGMLFVVAIQVSLCWILLKTAYARRFISSTVALPKLKEV